MLINYSMPANVSLALFTCQAHVGSMRSTWSVGRIVRKSILIGCLVAVGSVAFTSLVSAVEREQRLWPDTAPNESQKLGAEMDTTKSSDNQVADKSVIRLGNVSDPTLTFYPAPEAKNTGTAVVIFPGGGYHILAMDLEGTEVCEWLNSIGVTGVVVKYRVPRREGRTKHAAPLQDAQRAIGLVRNQCKDWKIDPHRVGVLGFSAGGHLAATASNNYRERTYQHVDDADKASCRPDFSLLIYPGYLTEEKNSEKLASELPVDGETPPTFLVMSQDDPVDARNVLVYGLALQKHKISYELHLYPKGGHGYGLRRTAMPVTHWPDLATEWLRQNNFIGVTP